MTRKKGGWYGESKRHALAAKGIKTGRKRSPKMNRKHLQTRMALRQALRRMSDREIEEIWEDYSLAIINLSKVKHKLPPDIQLKLRDLTAEELMGVLFELGAEGGERRERIQRMGVTT